MRAGIGGIAFGLGLAFFAAYQQFKLPVVMPVLLAEYAYDRTLAGGFMSIYAIAGLLLSVPLGRAIQRYGAEDLVVMALGLMMIGIVMVLAWPESGWLVLAARGLEGVAFAVLAISGPVLANASASSRQLPVVIGLTATWIPVGQLSATLLAAWLAAGGDWRVMWHIGFAAAAAFAAIALLASHGAGAPSRRGDPAAPPAPAALTRTQRANLVLAGAVFMLWSAQYFAYMTWLPQYLVEVFDFSVAASQLGYAIPVSLVLTFCIVTGVALRRAHWLGPLMVFGMAVQVVVWALVPVTGSGAGGVVSLIAYGCGAGIVPTCLFAMPSAILGRGHGTARAFGIVMTGRNMGVLIGPVLLAQAFKLTGTWSLAGPIFGLVTLVALVATVALVRRLHRQRNKAHR